MKKGLLLLVAAGAFLVSCGSGLEKEAATEFCNCYGDLAKAKEEIANSDSATDFLGSMTEMKEMSSKAIKCRADWDKKYNGKIDLDKFKEEVKNTNEAVLKMAEEEGVL